MNFYNENDPKAAAWIRELISAKLIPEGKVDERSITEITPDDLRGFVQCHFFAGISGWSYALKLAGWPDDRPVWTGSCPCQPFSIAGQGKGTADERHLWPAFFRLIRECCPECIFGEQVASKAALGWLDGVFDDLEGEGYACGAPDLCAASVVAPHIRQRLYWVADAQHPERRPNLPRNERDGNHARRDQEASGSSPCRENGQLEHPESNGRYQRRPDPSGGSIASGCEPGGMGDTDEQGSQGRQQRGGSARECKVGSASPWSNFDLIPCADGKARRIESGSFPLVARLPKGMVPSGDPSIQEVQASAEARVMRLRGYGNAIVPQLAAEFIKAFLDIKNGGLPNTP